MGRLFSMLLISMIMLCPTGRMHEVRTQPVFFSMLFPQLIPEWMLRGEEEGVML